MQIVKGTAPKDTAYLRRRARRTFLGWFRSFLDALVAGQEPLTFPHELDLGPDDAGELGIRLG